MKEILEEGMYIRTKYGIAHYRYYETTYGEVLCAPLTNGRFANVEDIDKMSESITDLIEEKDLLEIRYKIKSDEYQKEVVQVIKNDAGKLYVNTFPKKIFIEDFDRYGVEILSILNKEQFESQKYIVKK